MTHSSGIKQVGQVERIELLCSFVGGRYVDNKTGNSFPVYNPASGSLSYRVQTSDEFILQAAIESAYSGFLLWSSMPAVQRCRILNRAVTLLRERNDELARIEVRDTGKPWQEASTVDVASGADCLEFFAGLASSIEGNQQDLGADFYYTRREPLGICAGIGAWNYPLQIACWKAAPALACGNSMIFKPSEETPHSALKLAEIFIEAGMPPGVFNVVQGDGNVGAWLTKHPDIKKVSFTGEVATGQQVMSDSAAFLKPLTMELGGKSPLIVFDDADIEEAVSAAMLGNFYTQGEICTNCTRVYLQDSIAPFFIDRLLERTRNNIVIGDPMDGSTNFGALISEHHQKKVLEYIRKGVEEGATLLEGGRALSPDNAPGGYFVAPTILSDCCDDMTLVREEIFGPVMCILTFSEEDEVISRANNTAYGLAAGIYTRNIRRAHRVAHAMDAGICWLNSYGLSPVEMPVGGYKLSGIGRENGLETLRHYTQLKAVYVGMQPVVVPF